MNVRAVMATALVRSGTVRNGHAWRYAERAPIHGNDGEIHKDRLAESHACSQRIQCRTCMVEFLTWCRLICGTKREM